MFGDINQPYVFLSSMVPELFLRGPSTEKSYWMCRNPPAN